MADRTPNPANFFDKLRSEIRRLDQRIDNRAGFDATQLNRTVAKLEELVSGLLTQVNGIFSGFITAGGNITAQGTVTGVAGLSSLGVTSTNVTLLPGTRAAVWVNYTAGVLGQTVSTIVQKTNLADVPYSAAQFLQVIPYVFEYIGQVDIRDNPQNAYYDPNYVVPLEIGMMAEHLIEAGLELFVIYEADGTTPANIDYAAFGAVATLVIGRDHEQRITAIERALDVKA
jgi:hypothetical protein